MSRPVYTLGHSTRSAGELVALLREHGIELLVDVRRFPSSRRHPHFESDALADTLDEAGIGYRHEEALGGYRGEPDPESPNDGWESPGFRAYADHLNADEGREALSRLLDLAEERAVAVMCAEKAPWRCHRQIIADHLVAAGREVRHVLDEERVEAHELRAMADVRGDGRVVYPAEQSDLFGNG